MTSEIRNKAIIDELVALVLNIVAVFAGLGLVVFSANAMKYEEGLEIIKQAIAGVTLVLFIACGLVAIKRSLNAIRVIYNLVRYNVEERCEHIDVISNTYVLPVRCEKAYNNEEYGIVSLVKTGKKSKKCVDVEFISKEDARIKGYIQDKKEIDKIEILNYQYKANN